MKGLLRTGSMGKDIAIALMLILVVLLMVLPLPTFLVDCLIGLNFGIAILLLMTAVFLASPLALSSLPGIILISTLFRLSLSITTTRLILANGDAGAIVESFGAVVIAGNMVVGMVVFFIITVVQFIVIAKGAERIAEVGARFTLDALPGKQMSIDAELRNGDIDNAQARKQRKQLERESQFYGAMDGAMKFVKGDAIAGLVIIFVNLIGGLLVGMAQFGMSFAEAARTYSLLTVGDALVSQIPALFVAITAAAIVTRVPGETQANLGADIFAQISSNRAAINLAAATLAGMGLLPGFPTGILLSMGAVFAAISWAIGRNRSVVARHAEEQLAVDSTLPDEAPAEPEPPATVNLRRDDTAVELCIAPDIFALIDPGDFAGRIEDLQKRVSERVGLPAVAVSVRDSASLEAGQFRVTFANAPVFWSGLSLESVVVDATYTEVLEVHDIPFERRSSTLGNASLELAKEHSEILDTIGIPYAGPLNTLLYEVEETVVLNYSTLIGIEETKRILDALEKEYPMLVSEAARVVPIQRISEVFGRLLEEKVPIHNQRAILETIVEWAPTDSSALGLTEYCRIAMRQQICDAVADAERVITAVVAERSTDEMLREHLHETGVGTFLVLDDTQSSDLLGEIRRQDALLEADGRRPVVVTSMDVRRHLRAFLKRSGVQVDVLSFQELSDDYTVVPCNTLRVRNGRIQPSGDAATPDSEN